MSSKKTKKVSVSAGPWDYGNATIAREFGVDAGNLTLEFREFVLARPEKRNAKETPPNYLRRMARLYTDKHGSIVTEGRGDIDPNTGEESNPNSVKGKRKINQLEKYRRSGVITLKQMDAGNALLDAWERTQRSAPAIKEINVDTSPKPDANAAIMIDRISKLKQISQTVTMAVRPVVEHVVIKNMSMSNLPGYHHRHAHFFVSALRDGLDAVADHMEGR